MFPALSLFVDVAPYPLFENITDPSSLINKTRAKRCPADFYFYDIQQDLVETN